MINKCLMVFIAAISLLPALLPACAASKMRIINIGVIGPMYFTEGEHELMGAQMARDEINSAGGIDIEGNRYLINLIKMDSNEMLNPADAAPSMYRLITTYKPDFIVGGFRDESVSALTDVAMNSKKLFIYSGAASIASQSRIIDNYARYKYFFTGTLQNEYYLLGNDFRLLDMVSTLIKEELGIADKLKVAIVAERHTWGEAMVKLAQDNLPGMGMQITGAWLLDGSATDTTSELTAISDTRPDIIFTALFGPVGVPFVEQAGEMHIPAAILGIIEEAQKKGFYQSTAGEGNYVTTLNTYAKSTRITDRTPAWFDDFEKRTDQYPLYTAATYDAIYMIKSAIDQGQTLDPDLLVPLLENIDYLATFGRVRYYQPDTGLQPPATPHDIIYGPGFVTGVATQWQDGQLKCVWPQRGKEGWAGVKYDGTVPYSIPPKLIEKYSVK